MLQNSLSKCCSIIPIITDEKFTFNSVITEQKMSETSTRLCTNLFTVTGTVVI